VLETGIEGDGCGREVVLDPEPAGTEVEVESSSDPLAWTGVAKSSMLAVKSAEAAGA
jgi:hypothetical protein